MRLLILWASRDQPNIGVRALAAGAESIARRCFPDVEVQIQGTGRGDSPLPISAPRGLLKDRMTGRAGFHDWLKSFDVILDTRSGDSFADLYGLERLVRMSVVPELAHRYSIPVVLMPQTIGPFSSRRARFIARRALKQAVFVASRDHASAQAAAALGRVVDLESTDMVFALEHPEVPRTRDVVLNVSGLLWTQGNPHVSADKYRRDIRALIAALQQDGRSVTLLPHVLGDPAVPGDNDLFPLAQLREEIGDFETVIPHGEDALLTVRNTVGSAQVVIGARMHACLNALSMGTPAVPMAYSRKFAPLLADLGWSRSVDLHDDDVVSQVLAHVATPDLHDEATEVRREADLRIDALADALVQVCA